MDKFFDGVVWLMDVLSTKIAGFLVKRQGLIKVLTSGIAKTIYTILAVYCFILIFAFFILGFTSSAFIGALEVFGVLLIVLATVAFFIMLLVFFFELGYRIGEKYRQQKANQEE